MGRRADTDRPEPRGRVARLLGPTPRVPAAVHMASAFAEACFTVSLAGSLFLSISFDAARPRIIVYLACSLAPFVLVAPILGPLVDRMRGGHRAMVLITMALRVVICLALVGQLRALVVFPLAFAMLVLAKTYSVTRNALIPRLVAGDDLVKVNSRMSLLGTVSSGTGGACAAAVLGLTSARWVPLLGAVVFAIATLLATRLPTSTAIVVDPDVEIVWSELHARSILTAQSSMLALKGVTGFLLFFLGAYLKRTGVATWFFGLVFVANGVGSVVGNTLAPYARARLAEARMLAVSVAAGAAVAAVAAIAANQVGTVIAAFGIGLCASVAHQAFVASVQQHAPDVDRGRTLAAFDTRFQLAWVIGGLAAVTVRPPLRIGFASVMVLLLADVIDQWLRQSREPEEAQTQHQTFAQLARSARGLASLGQYRAATMVVTAAADLREPHPDLDEARARLRDDACIDRDSFLRYAAGVGWEFGDVEELSSSPLTPPPTSPSPR